jgi:hypothetical protein
VILYLANPCGPDVVAAMESGVIGMIDQPNQSKVTGVLGAHAVGAMWCADNGCFSDKWDEAHWSAWLAAPTQMDRRETCLFAVAPDVVGDAYATTVLFRKWGHRIRNLGYPVAYVAQDGLEKLRGRTESGGLTFPVPWESFDVLFIGGSTEWKLGEAARGIVAEAKQRGKWVHMGRVNSQRRFEYARAIGCDSADGTYLTFGPDVNLPKLLAWTRLNNQPGLWETP